MKKNIIYRKLLIFIYIGVNNLCVITKIMVVTV